MRSASPGAGSADDPRWRRRRRRARPAITVTAATAITGPATGPHAARACSSSRASRAVVPPGSACTGPAARPARPPRSAVGARSRQHVLIASPGSGGATAAPAGCWRACRRAISAGSTGAPGVFFRRRECLERDPGGGAGREQPGSLAADRSRDRSPADRRNSAATLSMACGDWRSRIWVAELAITARPRSVAEHVLGVLGDRGQAGVVLAAGLGHPEQEPGAFRVAHQQPRLIDGDQPPPSPGAGRRPAARSRPGPAASRWLSVPRAGPAGRRRSGARPGVWWSARRTVAEWVPPV